MPLERAMIVHPQRRYAAPAWARLLPAISAFDGGAQAGGAIQGPPSAACGGLSPFFPRRASKGPSPRRGGKGIIKMRGGLKNPPRPYLDFAPLPPTLCCVGGNSLFLQKCSPDRPRKFPVRWHREFCRKVIEFIGLSPGESDPIKPGFGKILC